MVEHPAGDQRPLDLAVLADPHDSLDAMAAGAHSSMHHFARQVRAGAGESPVALRRRVLHRAALAARDGITELYEKTRAEGFGAEVRRRIMIGTYVLSAGFYDAYYNRARKVRALIKRDFETVFGDGVDAILTPATPSAAFGLGEMAEADPVSMYLNDVFTVTVNLAGLPGLAIPVGLDSAGLPLGLQLIGRPWDEGNLLNHGAVLERAAGFAAKPSRWW